MDVPVSLGIAAAFAASAWTTLTGHGAVYYDSVAMFVFFLLTTRYFEFVARKRAAEASESRAHAVPAIATRLGPKDAATGDEQVLVADLKPGDRVLIRPGESIPSDGMVLDGASAVDESLLTGESTPVAKRADDALIGGSVNIDSPLVMRVKRVGEDTVLAAILRLLDRAQSEKPQLAQLADRVAAWFVAGVLTLAGAVAYFWWSQGSSSWLPITVAVLVVTCPCALSLATPTAFTAATGTLTRLGLLTTRGHALETLARATHFIFDKTGTLTVGQLRLLDVYLLSDMNRDDCLGLAVGLEHRSEHPIARALAKAYNGPISAATQVTATPGAGMAGTIETKPYYLGTAAFIADQTGHAIAPTRLDDLRQGGATVVVLATKARLLAAFALADEVRPRARALIASLKGLGKNVALFTGDHAGAATRVARAVGIDDFISDLKPADKLRRVQKLQHQGAVVAMVGDGVNDAPVLAAADVSLAMSAGTHVAAANADMLLMSNDLSHLGTGLIIARKTLRIIRQNLAWAVLYNVIAVPAAAAGYVAPWMAALGMSLSSLLVVTNSARLIEKRKRDKARLAVPSRSEPAAI
jgi:Cu2+-exporting ATPase